ncbi:AraC family transcriptional regulator [Flavobacterium album]|uniref:AraC family transcriptional regulator n=1 Tax=Flavobacterium album TaxID=2175091 RepID=A0A2S1R1U4_9FLAO|nr:AraC family transcriptional regulator [Flavobacterium album]AWH86587.1 AraC family transcriptional regulator [Flavobacterium album]
MNLYLKYNLEKTCRVVLQEQLEQLGLDYTIAGSGNIVLGHNTEREVYNMLIDRLNYYGIEIVDDKKGMMVQRTKDAIIEMLNSKDLPVHKISSYLSEKVGANYRSISQAFSEVCCISLESFIIIHKIERAKKLLTNENMSLTEIAYALHYSSVAHLSNQFKKITGLTPTAFHKVIMHKRNYLSSLN